ncbi:hypothetical protein ADN00_07980 [Ornatilinea apprima]|uniref:Phosphomevalonate dehydratase large subunit-like domain-containing protein n=1 Tax=Ornatilinea apprima TaxID=1134406 RepID=A0A0P6XWJ1_9CHLR|nr:aconitase X catalytic domain-containing protein [Ornatilinea apprima]KPL77816.1 hypothetical protein ADN00_07980 [Ornatilinea apprima]
MNLTPLQTAMLDGAHGRAAQKSMQILAALGKIYGAEELIPVTSVQIAGVSYANLGEAGLAFLSDMADGGGKTRVLTTLNPAGMDIENWQALGISPEFARDQTRVIEAFSRMGVVATCSCTPYLVGNVPLYGQHIAWSESSAVCFANSVLGARTNREGGPSALASALTGFSPAYGLHLDEQRVPRLHFHVEAPLSGTFQFGALGKVIGEIIEKRATRPVPYLTGIPQASLEELKSFCASIATYGGAGLFHIQGVTPEASLFAVPAESITISSQQIHQAIEHLSNAADEPDFISLGCPHLSIDEIAHLAQLLVGRQVRKEFWITTARPIKQMADRMGYTRIIEQAGAKFAADTCCVVAPIQGRFKTLLTDSAKACYYARGKNKFNTLYRSFEEVVNEATR